MKRMSTSVERYTNKDNDVFNRYLREIYDYHPLTAKDETILINKMNAGSIKAKELLIKHNTRFVISIAKQYYGNNITLNDLVNEGNYGLILAIDKFDSTKGFKFISYAVWWIRKTILEFLNNKGEAVRVPVSQEYKFSKIRKMFFEFEQKRERIPTEDEIINLLGGDVHLEDVRLFFIYEVYGDQKLDEYVGEDSKVARRDFLVNNIFPNADNNVNLEDNRVVLNQYLTFLKPNQRKVINLLYGLEGCDEITMDSISMEMEISKERVRQLKLESLKILKSKIKLHLFN